MTPIPKTISLEWLKKQGACWELRQAFRDVFGEGEVPFTPGKIYEAFDTDLYNGFRWLLKKLNRVEFYKRRKKVIVWNRFPESSSVSSVRDMVKNNAAVYAMGLLKLARRNLK